MRTELIRRGFASGETAACSAPRSPLAGRRPPETPPDPDSCDCRARGRAQVPSSVPRKALGVRAEVAPRRPGFPRALWVPQESGSYGLFLVPFKGARGMGRGTQWKKLVVKYCSLAPTFPGIADRNCAREPPPFPGRGSRHSYGPCEPNPLGTAR